jgi:hypothetical protein
MRNQDEKLGAPPIPYGPYAVGEALALGSRILQVGRAKLATHRSTRLEPKGAAQ